MAKTNTIPFPQNITPINATIVNATSFTAANPGTAPTNTILVTTAGANDSIIKRLTVASTDTSAATIQWWKSPDGGTTKYLIGITVIAALSGAATLINVDVLGNSTITGMSLDETGKPVLMMSANGGTPEKLYACVITSAVTASKNLYITGEQVDY